MPGFILSSITVLLISFPLCFCSFFVSLKRPPIPPRGRKYSYFYKMLHQRWYWTLVLPKNGYQIISENFSGFLLAKNKVQTPLHHISSNLTWLLNLSVQADPSPLDFHLALVQPNIFFKTVLDQGWDFSVLVIFAHTLAAARTSTHHFCLLTSALGFKAQPKLSFFPWVPSNLLSYLFP